MKIKNTIIEETFAEAFTMNFTRLVVTAIDEYWLDAGLREFCGNGSSVIQCDAEVGIETLRIDNDQTFDGRIGASVMAFGFSSEALGKAVAARTGQCLMTCPTTAVFDGMSSYQSDDSDDGTDPQRIAIGNHLRYFGDGFQKSKIIGDRRLWRIPVMDGEFIVEDTAGVEKGVAGGNFLIHSIDQATGLAAARRAVSAIDGLPNVITPFPGGVVRSGSKVGSKYEALRASTSDAYCPTLRGRVTSNIHDAANCIYEIVIDGSDFDAVELAIRDGIVAAVGDGVVAIGAGNYGGELGKHHFHLHNVLDAVKENG